MRLNELTEKDARAIAGWRYPSPYDCYDYPVWARMEPDHWAICDTDLRRDQFQALRLDETARPDPAGYVRFRPTPGALVLHLGLHPDLCGRGLGDPFLRLILAESRRRTADGRISLQVRRFNARAQTVYRRAGFRVAEDALPAGSTGPQDLVTMTLTRLGRPASAAGCADAQADERR